MCYTKRRLQSVSSAMSAGRRFIAPMQPAKHLQKLHCLMQVSGHGNFGSLDNDPPAAMRYTECRLQAVSSAVLLADLDYETVDFAPNFDGSQVGLMPPYHQISVNSIDSTLLSDPAHFLYKGFARQMMGLLTCCPHWHCEHLPLFLRGCCPAS